MPDDMAKDEMQGQRDQASAWFYDLRDRICAAFEKLEDEQTSGPFADLPAGRFERTPTERPDGGGGEMSVMRGGRCFEKVGVNVSAVHGELSEAAQQSMRARKDMEGIEDDPRFWASGISLVAHMRSPKCPAVHMNTRMFWTPHAWWFGGGSDLNPMREVDEDTAFFHDQLKIACDAHDPDYYPRFKDWADDYFLIRHRGEARGVGGIFYDDLCTGDWEADFAFTQDVGRAFLKAFLPITEKWMVESWTDEDRGRFRKLAHDLRGSGGAYGFADITETAGVLEDRVMDGEPDAALAPALDALIGALDRALAQEGACS